MQVVAQLSMQDLPEDVPGLSIRAREPLSEPFEVSVRFVSADPGRAVKDWLWTEAALQLQDAEGSGSRKQLLSGAGLPSAAWDLGGFFRDHPARGYLTRWKESALTFRSRLL